MLPKDRPRFFRRAATLLLKGLAACLIILLAAVAGAFVWLRTPSAAGFLAETATNALSGMGLTLTMGDLSGPVPDHLVIKDFVLADEQGVLIRADAVVLRVNLPALFRGRLDIPEVRLDSPELIRLPSFPSDDSPAGESGGMPAIPLDIVLGELVVTDGKLHTAALLPPPESQETGSKALPEENAAHAFPEQLNFALSGAAALKKGALSAALKTALHDSASQGITLDLQLSSNVDRLLGIQGAASESASSGSGSAPHGEDDVLRLSLRAGEGPGGPVAALLNMPDFPGYALDFTGSGPVRDWRGVLAMEFGSASGTLPAGDAANAAQENFPAALFRADTTFSLHCNSGSFWSDLVAAPDFGLDIRSGVRSGGKTPEALLPLLGKVLNLQIRLNGKEQTYTAAASIQSPAFAVRLSEAVLSPFTPAQSGTLPVSRTDGTTITRGTQLRASLEALTLDMQALVAAGKGENASGFPLTDLKFTAALEALMDADFSAANTHGRITASADDEEFNADYSVALERDGPQLILKDLTLRGLGILARLTATTQSSTWAVQANADVTADDHAPWQELLARLAGLATQTGEGTAPGPSPSASSPSLGGAVRLEASLDFPGLPESAPGTSAPAVPPQATGSLRLRAADLRWPSEQLAAMAGRDITASAHLTGGGGSPYSLRLEELTAGIFSVTGSAQLTPDSRKGGADEFLDGTLQAAFSANISDLAPLAGPESGLSGAIRAGFKADGPLDALHVVLEAGSPSLTTQAGKLDGIQVLVDALTNVKNGGFSGKGTLKAGMDSSPGGPVRLSSGWESVVPGTEQQGHPLSASIKDFIVQGAGIALKAELSASLPQGGGAHNGQSPAFPALNGTLTADITDWAKVAALSGAPLSGAAASADVTLGQSDGRQSATLKLSMPHLRMGTTGEPATFFLRGLSAHLNASDLFGAPSLDFSLQTGRGGASFLRWTTGTASIKGTGGSGAFSLALLQEAQGRAGRPQAVQGGSKRRENNPERLALQGSYDLSKLEVLLTGLALRDPASRTGLALQKTLTISLADGIRVNDLDIGFQPSGRLTAQAALAPDTLEMRASLQSLPFTFFKLFTPATLPDGQLSAQADFHSSAQGPQGSFSVVSHMSATQAASGMAKSGTPAAAQEEKEAAKAGAAGNAAANDAAGTNTVNPGAPGLNASGPASPSSSVFELRLEGNLSSNPGPSAVSGAGVRQSPGIIWLRGNGSFGTAGKTPESREGHLAFQLPLRMAPNGVPAPDNGAPLAASLRWNGPIAALWQVAPMPDRYLSGQAYLDANLFGTLDAPRNRVSAYLAGGRFEDVTNGILVNGIALEARNTETGDVRALLSADDGQSGRFALKADLTGLSGHNAAPALKVRGQLDRFSPLHRDDLSISLSGLLGVNGPLDALAVTGNIRIDQGEFQITSQLGGSVPTLDVETKKRNTTSSASKEESGEADGESAVSSGGPTLDLRIAMPRYFYIRGMGLDSEWQGDLSISGMASEPSLKGSLSPVRGYMSIFSRDFVFSGGDISFAGGLDINPLINLVLTYEGPNITAFIRASGTGKKPKLSLESRPPLPQDEVLSHVLFGKRTSDLSRFEAIQLANSMRELTGIGGSSLDILTDVRKKTGLDMLRIGGTSGPDQRTTSGQSGESNLVGQQNGDSSEAGAPALEAGKYINDSIYVGVEQGATEDSTSVRVEVELFPSVTLQGKSSSEASEVGVGWKMDY